MSSKTPSFSPESKAEVTSYNPIGTRRQFMMQTLAAMGAAAVVPSGCAGFLRNTPKNSNEISKETKLKLSQEVKFANETSTPSFLLDENHQPDDSFLGFGVGPLDQTVNRLNQENRKAMASGIGLSEMDEVEYEFSEEPISDNTSIVCVRTRKKAVIQTSKPTKPNQNNNQAYPQYSEPREMIPSIPDKPKASPEPAQKYSTIENFKEKIGLRARSKEYEISHLYSRYIVKKYALQNKKAPEDNLRIRLTCDENGRVRKIAINGMGQQLRRENFDTTIKNYAKRWRFPRNPEADSFKVDLKVKLNSPDVETGKGRR